MLEARGLACRRGGRLVFDALDLALRPGELALITGSNGAGKSSLLRVLAGLLPPAAGRLDRAGETRFHYLGHGDAVQAALSLRENLAFWVRLAGRGSAEAGLEAVGLARLADLPARLLSAGQRRRLALARLFAAPAPLWLLDEPVTGLDREATTRFEQGLARHLEGGGAAAISAHAPLGPPAARQVRLGPA